MGTARGAAVPKGYISARFRRALSFSLQPWMKMVASDMDEKARVAAQLQAESRARKGAAARRRRQQADPEVKAREAAAKLQHRQQASEADP